MKTKQLNIILVMCLSFLLLSCQSNTKDTGVVGRESTTVPLTTVNETPTPLTTEIVATNVQNTEATTTPPSGVNYDQVAAYMKRETTNVFSVYYELLGFEISNYQETVVDENVAAIFSYKLKYKNFDKDPDTVPYIKEAKESGSRGYKLLYDDYLAPKEANFMLKVVIDEADLMTLYSNVSFNGTEWAETKMSDFIVEK